MEYRKKELTDFQMEIGKQTRQGIMYSFKNFIYYISYHTTSIKRRKIEK